MTLKRSQIEKNSTVSSALRLRRRVERLIASIADRVLPGSPPAVAIGTPVCGVVRSTNKNLPTVLIIRIMEKNTPAALAHKPIQTVFVTEF